MRFGPYRPFKVYDPKERTISVAPFYDRVAHHALMNVCEPVFERYAIFDTYACRTGKGSHAAVRRARHFARRFPWFLKLDITRYYANIDHCLMPAALVRLFKDPVLLRTFEHLLNSFSGPVRPGAGIPVGNLTSQHFANHFLGALDHWVKEDLHVPGYVRYMDDFVLWARHKAELVATLREVRGFVRDRLNLEIRDDVLLNRSDRGLPFLGYRVFPKRILLAEAKPKAIPPQAAFMRAATPKRGLERRSRRATRRAAGGLHAACGCRGLQAKCYPVVCRTAPCRRCCIDRRRVDKDRAASEGSNRVKRGGSWNNNASNCLVSNRNNNTPGNSNNNIGFRPVLSAAQQPRADAWDCWTGRSRDWTNPGSSGKEANAEPGLVGFPRMREFEGSGEAISL